MLPPSGGRRQHKVMVGTSRKIPSGFSYPEHKVIGLQGLDLQDTEKNLIRASCYICIIIISGSLQDIALHNKNTCVEITPFCVIYEQQHAVLV